VWLSFGLLLAVAWMVCGWSLDGPWLVTGWCLADCPPGHKQSSPTPASPSKGKLTACAGSCWYQLFRFACLCWELRESTPLGGLACARCCWTVGSTSTCLCWMMPLDPTRMTGFPMLGAAGTQPYRRACPRWELLESTPLGGLAYAGCCWNSGGQKGAS